MVAISAFACLALGREDGVGGAVVGEGAESERKKRRKKKKKKTTKQRGENCR